MAMCVKKLAMMLRLWNMCGRTTVEFNMFVILHHIDYFVVAFLLPLPLRKPQYLFLAYKYIHQYPARENESVLGISSTTLHNKVLPTLHTLATGINEIHWEDRLDPYNHTPDFPYYVTGIVDTVPIVVLEPEDALLRHWLFNPKYGAPVYKAQIAIDFLGRIIFFSGPHLGLYYDGHILAVIFLFFLFYLIY